MYCSFLTFDTISLIVNNFKKQIISEYDDMGYFSTQFNYFSVIEVKQNL